jgi:DNA-binding response OmpR family regulator
MKVLLVEDEPEILELMTFVFQLQWRDCTLITATNANEALRRFCEDEPDIIVLDVLLPGKNGFELLQEIRPISDVPIILVTALHGEIDQVRGLELGADDYVTKPFSYLALMARVKAVLRRAKLPPPVRALPDFVAGDLAIDFQNQQVTLGGEPVKLTRVEFKLLYHLVRNAGRLVHYQTLLNRVWGPEYEATTDYLKVFISRLRAKIEPDADGPHYIENERGVGYRFVCPKDAAPATLAEDREPRQASSGQKRLRLVKRATS